MGLEEGRGKIKKGGKEGRDWDRLWGCIKDEKRNYRERIEGHAIKIHASHIRYSSRSAHAKHALTVFGAPCRAGHRSTSQESTGARSTGLPARRPATPPACRPPSPLLSPGDLPLRLPAVLPAPLSLSPGDLRFHDVPRGLEGCVLGCQAGNHLAGGNRNDTRGITTCDITLMTSPCQRCGP